MEEKIVQKISTSVAGFDRLLGGGLEPQMITQFVGEAGSGKSTLCMVAAVSVLRQGGGVVYVDSEGFSVDRFSQIAGEDTPELLKRIYVLEPITFAEQGAMIASAESLLRAKKADLLVVDSATALYRVEQMETKEALSMLSHQMMVLLALAKRFSVPALITNQVFMDVEKNRLSGLGGTALAHISKAIVRVEKREGFRRAVITKHRSRPEGEFWDFVITGFGVSDR
ncbi:DNA repair and recombination protein RadB [Methanorbis furvi]|uniref:DNA repair and recombination protein RadB n=1 Tax=Methanorbis furvi TaxID=3028299 RepID=A0AAE4SBX5_9EURY|nr:DNA repair protein RadA [Methanocorpusculaceae archaeon Ag1]